MHDLRRTVASGLEILGVPANVISTALNHISAKKASVTGRHYLHGDSTRSVQAALTEWQGTLEAILYIEAMEERLLAVGARAASHIFALYRSALTAFAMNGACPLWTAEQAQVGRRTSQYKLR